MDDIIADLLNYAFDHNIGYELTHFLDPHTPSLADTKRRKIIINMGYYRPCQIPLQIGHEITHVLNGDRSYHQLIGFESIHSDPRIELAADRGGIQMLLPYYLEGKELEQINVKNFMDLFDIPSHLHKTVVEEIHKCVEKHY
ncbi:ImmA/IrrE family metallo-endopeptidase [Lentilactobacillus hilgardii]|uniref:ImmA/IrrE family metallo-endopeptidase n=1 Tax=Lentilactobacillus hilgardii TaxID=1588 RepID=UPI00390CA6D9